MNCVCPGMTNTPMIGKTGYDGKPAEWLAPAMAAMEMIQPEEIAKVVIKFIEDDSLNGETVTVQNRPKVETH